MELAGSADIGGGMATAYADGDFGGELGAGTLAVAGLEITMELTPAIASSSIYLGAIGLANAEPTTSELDAELISTINDIGAKVLSEVLGENTSEDTLEATLDEPTSDYPLTELPLADQADEASPTYVPGEWITALQPVSELDEPTDVSNEQPLQDDALRQPADLAMSESPLIDSDETDLQVADTVQPTPAVASIVEAINTELLPEVDTLVDGPTKSVLYGDETSPSQTISTSHEVFETLLMQRGASLDATSYLEAVGKENGVDFIDKIEYVPVSADLTLILHTRTYPQSGTSTADVVAAPSLATYLQQEDRDRSQRDSVHITWQEEQKEYDVAWEDPYNSPAAFPEDIEITLRRTFTNRWKAKDNSSDTVILDAEDPEAQEREDDYILRGVNSAITSARPQALKPRVVGP